MARTTGKTNGGGLGLTGRNNGLTIIPKSRTVKSGGGGGDIATGKIFSAPKSRNSSHSPRRDAGKK